MNQEKQYTAVVGGESITIATGKLAGQAGGAVTVRLGDTMLLATATMSKRPREGIDFFPLSVDFEERLYAAGRIPGSFFRREGRPTE
ncbi:MAG: polyribonucleotide nucleotidyltransferase, partial [Deltaproteobacteria bacterium]|nr:polyribonucleotide nucleotidyltransferase [Deltaproteobacteria bacterium]